MTRDGGKWWELFARTVMGLYDALDALFHERALQLIVIVLTLACLSVGYYWGYSRGYREAKWETKETIRMLMEHAEGRDMTLP